MSVCDAGSPHIVQSERGLDTRPSLPGLKEGTFLGYRSKQNRLDARDLSPLEADDH